MLSRILSVRHYGLKTMLGVLVCELGGYHPIALWLAGECPCACGNAKHPGRPCFDKSND